MIYVVGAVAVAGWVAFFVELRAYKGLDRLNSRLLSELDDMCRENRIGVRHE